MFLRFISRSYIHKFDIQKHVCHTFNSFFTKFVIIVPLSKIFELVENLFLHIVCVSIFN